MGKQQVKFHDCQTMMMMMAMTTTIMTMQGTNAKLHRLRLHSVQDLHSTAYQDITLGCDTMQSGRHIPNVSRHPVSITLLFQRRQYNPLLQPYLSTTLHHVTSDKHALSNTFSTHTFFYNLKFLSLKVNAMRLRWK